MSAREYRRFLLQGQEVQRFGENVKYVPVSFAAFQDVETGIIVGDIASFEAWLDRVAAIDPVADATENGVDITESSIGQVSEAAIAAEYAEMAKEEAKEGKSGSKRRSGTTGSSEG